VKSNAKVLYYKNKKKSIGNLIFLKLFLKTIFLQNILSQTQKPLAYLLIL